MTPYISILIPAYNISQNHNPSQIENVKEYLKQQKYSFEVIFIDDGSSDDTPKILSKFVKGDSRFKIITAPHTGKCGAISNGVKAATGKFILFTDFDQSTPLYELEKFIPVLENDADLVIANRIRNKQKDSLMSYLRSKLFNSFVRIIALPSIPDTQCGFKAFRNEVGKIIFNSLVVCKPKHITGPYMGAFDVEFIVIALKKGYKIVSVPVAWNREVSKNLKFSEPLKMIAEVVKIKMYYSFSKP